MPTPPPTPRESDPGVDAPPRLPAQTAVWLAEHPHARKLGTVVRSVWDTLTELERAGHHPETITRLRGVLTEHQPTRAGRCRSCPRWSWRHWWSRRAFPCIEWLRIRDELLARAGRHRQPATLQRPGTTARPPGER